MKAGKLLASALAGCAVAAAVAAAEADFPSLAGATGWLNSAPLTPESLRGKVVLVDFWTFTCINWRREFPYVRAWAEKYKAHGLVVIGVHTPEFEFEKDPANVARAARDIAVTYPVAVDSDSQVWGAFGNQYWPALYFIDAKGRIRHHHFGEGGYDESERMIKRLLIEAGATGIGPELVQPQGRGPEAPPDLRHLRSPENYLGYGRTENFASPGGAVADKPRNYAAPARLRTNHWGLAGEWTVKEHGPLLGKAPGRIAYGFHARDLHLVMGPSRPGSPVRFRVLVDGQPPGSDAGSDVDAQGAGVATEQRMYQLIRQQGPVRDRRFEIEFLDPGVEAFAFSFG